MTAPMMTIRIAHHHSVAKSDTPMIQRVMAGSSAPIDARSPVICGKINVTSTPTTRNAKVSIASGKTITEVTRLFMRTESSR